MFNISNKMLQSEIRKAKIQAQKDMLQLRQTLETLVYWENLYNKENLIDKNSKYLNMLISINNMLGEETPSQYFIDKTKLLNRNRLLVKVPEQEDIMQMDDLTIVKTEMFLLKDNEPSPQTRIIMKTETDGAYQFFMRTKYKNIETEKILDAAEYLKLTTSVNLDISRISVMKYIFSYNGNHYNLIFDIKNPDAATLNMIDTDKVPDFIETI